MVIESVKGRADFGSTSRLTEVALGYQRVLEQNPCHIKALMGMSLVAMASRQPEAAIRMAQAAVTAAPRMGTAWVTLGQAFKSVGRHVEAKQAYEAAICLDGMDPLARMGLGELRMATGRPEEALREFDLALRRRPTMAAAHMGMGHALACLGRNTEALERYKLALTFAPRMPEAEFSAAFVLVRLGRAKEAEVRYRRTLALRPGFAEAWMNLGCLLRDEGREIYAEAALVRAVELRPSMISGWINLALLKREQQRPDEAEAHLRKAFERDPENADTLLAWCQFRAAERDLAGAWEWLRWALARKPGNAEAVNMRGILLHAEGRFAEAIGAFREAEALGSRAAASNRGNSLMDLGRMDEALRAHEAAVQHDRRSAGAEYNLALTRLRLGDWERGWVEYEARWRFREVHRAPMVFRKPRWRGESLGGRRVLLHAEQGLGDAIQFARYVALVAARGGIPIVQVHEPVERLMHSLAVVRAGLARVACLGVEPPAFDLECPLMSLPAVFGTTVDTVPWTGAYLRAEPELVIERQIQIPHKETGLRVGLAWAGNPRYKADSRRSMKLRTLLPLLRMPGIHWISLQKGEAAGQLARLPDNVSVSDGSSRDCDLAQTAALLSKLDLVITTDTCIAHLAGAMGKPVWILLPHLADWRWMQGADMTPWYPQARLVRQIAPGDWPGVLERVIADLGTFSPPPRARKMTPRNRQKAAIC